ncbi:nitrous oxide-stimulated promoter family protein [bacterium]|nr:nitrous oxide-stimulated promoter family protein [bacterium]MBU1883329.1 nitrous oxide-stimulated promoter family protein [bacterium]
MNKDKFESEVKTLKQFFETYCDANDHEKEMPKASTCRHKELTCRVEVHLCRECSDLLDYSLIRLEECPYEIKPRCRTCQNPCYDKHEWKKLAKVMRFSGLKLGILKVRKMIGSVFLGHNAVK